MADTHGPKDFSHDTKFPIDNSSDDEKDTYDSHRDYLAGEAPQVVNSWPIDEKGVSYPTPVQLNTSVPPQYTADAQSPQVATPFSPLYPAIPENAGFGDNAGRPDVARQNTFNTINFSRNDSVRNHVNRNIGSTNGRGSNQQSSNRQSSATYGDGSAAATPATEKGMDWSYQSHQNSMDQEQPPPFICGLRRRSFWILIIVAFLIIVAAAVGGGVGGALANNNSSSDSVAATTITSTARPTPTRENSHHKSPEPTSNTHKHQPHERFKLTVWEGQNYTGQSQQFYQAGGYKLQFVARSYDWELYNYHKDNEHVCSAAVCRKTEELGWFGSSSKKSIGHLDEPHWGFDNIFIACGVTWADPGCKGPIAIETFTQVPVISGTEPKSVHHPKTQTQMHGSKPTGAG